MNACMGGYCAKRDQCPHYHAVFNHDPAERLCLPGQDGVQLERVAGQVVAVDLFRRHACEVLPSQEIAA